MANLTKNRPARCQCAISNRLFNSLIKGDFFRVMDIYSYPHLWRPMYKIEDQPYEQGYTDAIALPGSIRNIGERVGG